MESKYTKGPWEVVEHSWSDTSIIAGNKTICTNSICEEATEETQDALEEEATANFNLMRSAPELLEALELLWAAFNYDDTTDFHNIDIETTVKSAINKAKGV